MNISFVYLSYRLLFNLRRFVFDWFIGGFRAISHKTLNILERLDRVFAWRITWRNFFRPLYQDHTIVGHSMGLVFRILRLILATFAYLIIIVVALTIYLIWIFVPIVIVFRGFMR